MTNTSKRVLTSQLHDHIDKEIILKGWVDSRRDHGKLIFLDLRDRGGYVQMVVLPEHEAALEIASTLRPEWVVEITGKVNERPERMKNADTQNGDLEIEVLEVNVLNQSETPPFDVTTDGYEVSEEIRMKYRYLDLRRPRMQRNLRERDRIITFFREHMHNNGFVEIETPMLMKDTPEGSREYIVPSRLQKGHFYALPQSPQQFKQLSMVAGFERYFQVARCMRDEDLRGDRQPEFTQLDYEMSFVEQEDVLNYTEEMFIKMVNDLYPDKKIMEKPFPRLTYAEAMEKYGSDKPDLRADKNDNNELAFAWVVDFPMFEKMEDGSIQSMHHPFCSIHPEDMELFMKDDLTEEELLSIRANAYDLILNGYELSSGSIRIHEQKLQKKVFERLGIDEQTQQERFSHMLDAFTYGAPPHGGFAPGIDRIVMLMMGEPNIREVTAFPKTGEGKDLMMSAPAKVSKKQLTELGIKLIDEK